MKLLTIVLAVYVILFANELIFIQDVEFLASGQLLSADHAGETLKVEHFASGSPDQVIGTDALRTTTTFGSKASESIFKKT